MALNAEKTLHVIQDHFHGYSSRFKKSKDHFQYATQVSLDEVLFNYHLFRKNPQRTELFTLLKTATNTSVWVSRSSFRLMKSFIDFKGIQNANEGNSRAQYILDHVCRGSRFPAEAQVTNDEIFKTIYHELIYSHLHTNYRSRVQCPDNVNVTIVLVSGVLNEIFSTPAFKRGAEHLFKHYRIEFLTPYVDGTKSAHANSVLLKEQLIEYSKTHRKRKFWFISFSKGGIDTLHFLKENPEFAEKYVAGLSLIASPILGSNHIETNFIKLVNAFTHIPESISKSLLGKKIDPVAKELQKSLSASYRRNWFRNNHRKLPQSLFYSALALESKWYESHIWMILTKSIFRSKKANDGIVDVENAQFPNYFKGLNLGVLQGHHLIGNRSSFYNQEALLEAHLVLLRYLKHI